MSSSSASELQSISASLDELIERISHIAEENSTQSSKIANDLFEVERNLNAGALRLRRALYRH